MPRLSCGDEGRKGNSLFGLSQEYNRAAVYIATTLLDYIGVHIGSLPLLIYCGGQQ